MAADANGKEYWIYPDDWEDEGTRTGSRQEYNLSINGGSDRGTFYASAGYLKTKASLPSPTLNASQDDCAPTTR